MERRRRRRPEVGRRAALAVFLAALAVCSAPAAAAAEKFVVGDDKGWNPNVNYTVWEKKHRPFYKGDWLVFNYQKGQADVVEVDEVAYEKCDAANPIANYSKGHSYDVQLAEARTYYFICSYGYCYTGMKLAVTAQKPPTPPPSAAGKSASAAAAFLGSGVAVAAAAGALLVGMA